MRETLRIMSLSRTSYMLANFASEAAHACVSSMVLFYGYMVPMWLNDTYTNSVIYQENPWVFLIALILNGLSLVSLSLALSAFFFDSKIASQIGMFILFLPCAIFLFSLITVVIKKLINDVALETGTSDDNYYGIQLFQIGYVLPHFSFSIVFLEFLTKGGASFLGFNVVLAWIMLIIQTPLYLCLYLYLDAVIPNQYGIALKCCFCCRRDPKEQEIRLDEHEIELM